MEPIEERCPLCDEPVVWIGVPYVKRHRGRWVTRSERVMFDAPAPGVEPAHRHEASCGPASDPLARRRATGRRR